MRPASPISSAQAVRQLAPAAAPQVLSGFNCQPQPAVSASVLNFVSPMNFMNCALLTSNFASQNPDIVTLRTGRSSGSPKSISPGPPNTRGRPSGFAGVPISNAPAGTHTKTVPSLELMRSWPGADGSAGGSATPAWA